MTELRVTIASSSDSKTFEMINFNIENDITDKHRKFLNRYRLCVIEESKGLPHIHWLPKLKKNPIKA